MFIVISSDSPTVATRLRKALAAHGHECPFTHVVGLDQVEAALQAAGRPVELLMIVLPADQQRSITLLRRLRAVTSARLVAVGSARDSKHILEALHAGADDYLDDEADVGEQVAASLERVAVQPGAPGGGRVVAVTSASGGSGCSMLAANLAVLLAKSAGTCGLIDLAAGFGDLAALLNVTPRHTLGDLYRNHESLDREMLLQSLTAHDSGVKLLAAPGNGDDADAAAPHSLERILHLSRGVFPWCVLDVDCRDRRHDPALRAAGAILLVFRLDFTSLCNARRLLNEWEQRQVDAARVRLIANRCGQPSEIPSGQVRSLLGKEICISIPDDAHSANVGINCGNPVVLEAPKSALSRAFAATTQLLLGAAGGAMDGPGPGAAQQAAEHDNGILRRAAGILFC